RGAGGARGRRGEGLGGLAAERRDGDRVGAARGRIERHRQAPPGAGAAAHADAPDLDAGVGAAEIVGRAQRVEQRRQAEIEDAVEHKHVDAHGKNDSIVVVSASGAAGVAALFFHAKGRCTMAQVHVGLLVTIKAKPGKEEEVASFLTSALPLANAEPKTVVWFAFRIDRSTFGVYDSFADDGGRNAHLT